MDYRPWAYSEVRMVLDSNGPVTVIIKSGLRSNLHKVHGEANPSMTEKNQTTMRENFRHKGKNIINVVAYESGRGKGVKIMYSRMKIESKLPCEWE